MQFRKKILMLSLAAMLLLTGCGGEPSAVEGAEPPSAPQVTVPDPQDTQSPQEPQELEPVPEVLSWDKTMQMVNADTILAKSKDGGFAILNNDGTVRASLPEYSSLTLKTPYCFIGSDEGKINLLDLNGSIITEDIQNVLSPTQTAYDPWGVIQYTAVERQDFGAKTTVCAMRTDTFEIIYQSERDDFSIRYDGEQYLIETTDPDSKEAKWTTFNGENVSTYYPIPVIHRDASILDAAPYVYGVNGNDFTLLTSNFIVDGQIELGGPSLSVYQYSENQLGKYNENRFGLMDLEGNKLTELIYEDSVLLPCGLLAITPDGKTDIFDGNGNLCTSVDSRVGFSHNASSRFAGLTTTVANKSQFGIFDFEQRKFIFTSGNSVKAFEIKDKYYPPNYAEYLRVAAFYLEGSDGVNTLLCGNGALVENVRPITEGKHSSCGRLLVQSTTEPDKIMIINVETGKIVSEFQAHLS